MHIHHNIIATDIYFIYIGKLVNEDNTGYQDVYIEVKKGKYKPSYL